MPALRGDPARLPGAPMGHHLGMSLPGYRREASAARSGHHRARFGVFAHPRNREVRGWECLPKGEQ